MSLNLRARRPRLILLLLALVAATAVAYVAARLWPMSDNATIAAERSRRLLLANTVGKLPGTPDLADLQGRLQTQGLSVGMPVFIRVFKREFELELWMRRDGRYQHFATYPICRWSGRLGPKLRQGDRQSPEGFYTVDRRALNPNSRWHRSFNLGFPNVFDRAHGRTGSYLMVHGGCSSVGCYAMTNAVIDEIWGLVTAALSSGQRKINVHVFPFRMSEDNLAARAGSEWAGFWRSLKPGYDAFEATAVPPRVTTCRGSYNVTSRATERGGGHSVVEDCKPFAVLPQGHRAQASVTAYP